MATRLRTDGSWAAFEDPNQMLLHKVIQPYYMDKIYTFDNSLSSSSIIQTNEREGKRNDQGNNTTLLNDHHLSTRFDNKLYQQQVLAIQQLNKDYDLRFRFDKTKQSVPWPLTSKFLGPFREVCKPPDWSNLEVRSWPRDGNVKEES